MRCPPGLLGMMPAGLSSTLLEKRSQPRYLSLGRLSPSALGRGTLTLGLGTLTLGVGTLTLGVGTLTLGVGTLTLGLGLRGNQNAIRGKQPRPGGLLTFQGTLPETEVQPEDFAPQTSLGIGTERLIEVAGQPESFQLRRVQVVEEVVPRAEHPGVELPLVLLVDLLGRRRQNLHDQVRQPVPLLPRDPGLALFLL